MGTLERCEVVLFSIAMPTDGHVPFLYVLKMVTLHSIMLSLLCVRDEVTKGGAVCSRDKHRPMG